MISASMALWLFLASAVGGGHLAFDLESAAADTACIVMSMRDFDSRSSPLDSVSLRIGDGSVKICYGRPSARGRTMIGGANVPFGEIWRTGANEPTMVHTTLGLDIGDVHVGPGSYSLYTVPGEHEWEVIVNRSLTQWGAERNYTEAVQAQEVGRIKVMTINTEHHSEKFTIRLEAKSEGEAALLLEWENTQVKVPLKASG